MWKLCKWAFMLLYSESEILNFGFDVDMTNVLTVLKAMSLRSLRLRGVPRSLGEFICTRILTVARRLV